MNTLMLNKSLLLFLVLSILVGTFYKWGISNSGAESPVTLDTHINQNTVAHPFAANFHENKNGKTPHPEVVKDFPSVNQIHAYQPSFIKSKGRTKTVMVFVDFDDYPAEELTTFNIADRFSRRDTLAQILHHLSRGQLIVKPIEVIHGWRRMPYLSSMWTNGHPVIGPNNPRHYCSEVLKLYPKTDFSKYDIIIIVPSKVLEFQRSPTHFLMEIPSGGQIAAVTCGLDVYKCNHPGRILAHEYGHQYGLPDLYRYSNEKFLVNTASASVGPWDIMANLYQTSSMLGFNQYVLGWLDKSKTHFIDKGIWEGIISPLFAKDGISMIGVADKFTLSGIPLKFYCVEVAPELQYITSEEEGILIYSVDTQIASGYCPIEVYRHETENVYQAPIQNGETLSNANLPMNVEVLEKIGQGYKIRITVK